MHIGLDNVIPPFTLSNYFVYFNSLSDKTRYNSSEMMNRKLSVLNQARGALGDVPNMDAKESDARVMNAFSFLANMAASECAKELAAIQQYKQEILDKIPDGKSEAADNIKALIAQLDGTYDGSIDKNFYMQLTTAINLLRREYDDYKNQLELIKREADEMKRMEGEYSKSQLARAQQGRLRGMDMSYMTQATLAPILNEWGKGSTRGVDDSLAGIVKENLYPFFREKLASAIGGLRGDADIIGLLTGIYLDFQTFLQNKINANPELWDATRRDKSKLKNYIDETFANYRASESEFLKSIEDQAGSFYSLMDTIKATLNIKAGSKMTDLLKADLSTLDNAQQAARDLLLTDKGDKSGVKLNEIFDFNFTASGPGMNGTLQEVVSAFLAANAGLIARGYTGKIGGDILTIKVSVGLNGKNNQYAQRLQGMAEGLDRIFSQLAKNQGRKNQAITTELAKQVNREADNLIRKIEEEMAELGYLNDIFIFHESDKLYSTMVTNRAVGGHDSAIFHGRNLSMLSYINEMYSMNGLGGLELVQEDTLKFLTANLAQGAIAQDKRGPLEKYFSLFAGMLMFDDLMLMAKDVEKDISGIHSTTKQVHLYSLNGVYVPASMIMQATYNQLMQVTPELNDMSARATIHVPSGFVTTGSPNNYYSLWTQNSANALQNTRIEITLFASFIQFIQGIFNYT